MGLNGAVRRRPSLDVHRADRDSFAVAPMGLIVRGSSPP
jgi:hypothetical protein